MDKKGLFYGIAKFFNIYGAIIATVGATLVCSFMLRVIGNEPGTLTPRAFVIGFYLIFVPVIWIATLNQARILKRNKNQPKQYTELESDLDTTYMQPLDRATVEPGETVQAWYGPMSRNDMAGTGTQVGLKENISGENTLLVTNRQIICLMVGPADTEGIETTNVNSTLSTVIEALPTDEGVYQRKQQFEIVWFNSWGKIMANITAPDRLGHMLETHRNYGIPLSSIQAVNIKLRFFNPGVYITLKNGKTLKFGGFHKQQLDTVQSALTGKVPVKSGSLLGLGII